MNKLEKENFIQSLQNVFLSNEIVLVCHYKGLNVLDMLRLRRLASELSVNVKVIKNSLAKVALRDTAYVDMESLFVGQVLILYAKEIISPAKLVTSFNKENEKLVLIGGGLKEGESLDIQEIVELSKLPSLEEIRVKLLFLITSQSQNIVRLLKAHGNNLTRLIKAYQESRKNK